MLIRFVRFSLALFVCQIPLGYAADCTHVLATAHPAYPPYQWFDGKQMRGASIDINQKIFAELGIPFSVTYSGPWKRVLHVTKRGQVDFVMALKKTPARQKFINFTEAPILPNPFSVFVERDNIFRYSHWEDLKGRLGGKNAGDRYGEMFDNFSKKQLMIEEANTPEINFNKLIARRIEYFIHSRYSGITYLHTHLQGQRVIALDKNINDGVVHSGFSLHSPCNSLLPYLNTRYREMLEDGSAMQIMEENILLWKNRTTGINSLSEPAK
ncbi:MAG: transporter substrate-binding domain-containing protein [Motiliproteus sp.]|nr:transporter substrate-binding domain-containing protein [Motiliproteus sp.]